MSILISLLILVLILVIVFWLLSVIPIPSPFNWIIKAIIAVIAIVYIVDKFL